MTSKGQSSFGQDQDDVVFIPYTTVMKKMRGIIFIQQVTVSAAEADDIDAVADRILSSLLRAFRHKIQPWRLPTISSSGRTRWNWRPRASSPRRR